MNASSSASALGLVVIHFVEQFCTSHNIALTSVAALVGVEIAVYAAAVILFLTVERPPARESFRSSSNCVTELLHGVHLLRRANEKRSRTDSFGPEAQKDRERNEDKKPVEGFDLPQLINPVRVPRVERHDPQIACVVQTAARLCRSWRAQRVQDRIRTIPCGELAYTHE